MAGSLIPTVGTGTDQPEQKWREIGKISRAGNSGVRDADDLAATITGRLLMRAGGATKWAQNRDRLL